MAELLELPVTAFNPNTGREAGLRSAELRQQQAKELDKLRLILADKPIPQIEQKPVNLEVDRQIEITNEQIALTRERLNDTKSHWCEKCERGGLEDKARGVLLRELRGLMEHLCRLHNIAQAPTSKATNKPQIQRQTAPEPVIPCGVAPTISSVPTEPQKPSTPQV